MQVKKRKPGDLCMSCFVHLSANALQFWQNGNDKDQMVGLGADTETAQSVKYLRCEDLSSNPKNTYKKSGQKKKIWAGWHMFLIPAIEKWKL